MDVSWSINIQDYIVLCILLNLELCMFICIIINIIKKNTYEQISIISIYCKNGGSAQFRLF